MQGLISKLVVAGQQPFAAVRAIIFSITVGVGAILIVIASQDR
jgi:hypothetical protein